jgi:glycosyltransferase involved in cell wall biosynthesis
MNVTPLIIVKARHTAISGGYRRLYEVLKRGKHEGINFIILTDLVSYQNFIQMFPDFKNVLEQYKSYFVGPNKIKSISSKSPRILKSLTSYGDFFVSAVSISKIVREENAELIVSPSEGTPSVWTSYLSGEMSRTPWTALFQGETPLFQPTSGLGCINPLNVLRHVSRKEFTRKVPLLSRVGFSIELLGLLKIAEKSLMLSVSRSLSEEISALNPRVMFHVITPGNGVDFEKFNAKLSPNVVYDAIFFSRLIPEKGMFDLLKTWKIVTKKFPRAKLAVAGIIEDFKFVEKFLEMISHYNLGKNVVYLGPQDQNSIIRLIKASKLTIYPSIFDAFPLVILESLACGTPVITYNISTVRHNFINCKAVLRCPIKDVSSVAKNVISILENENLRGQLSQRSERIR